MANVFKAIIDHYRSLQGAIRHVIYAKHRYLLGSEKKNQDKV